MLNEVQKQGQLPDQGPKGMRIRNRLGNGKRDPERRARWETIFPQRWKAVRLGDRALSVSALAHLEGRCESGGYADAKTGAITKMPMD